MGGKGRGGNRMGWGNTGIDVYDGIGSSGLRIVCWLIGGIEVCGCSIRRCMKYLRASRLGPLGQNRDRGL